MSNLKKITKTSNFFYLVISFILAVIPLFYAFFWIFINELPGSMIQVNIADKMLSQPVSGWLRTAGFLASLFPMFSLFYIFYNLRKLFAFYREGKIFSFVHVDIFKKISWGFLLWVISSIAYGTATSVIFSFNNPPGQRMLSVGIGSSELTSFFMAGIILVISRVMDEGRVLYEENQFTI